MATRTLLTPEAKKEAVEILQPPLVSPNGRVRGGEPFPTGDFSSWLSLHIEKRLRKIEGWEEAHPIAVGSWGRGDLSPCSDLDVIFCGDDESVKKVVAQIEDLQLKLRYRVPENRKDWTQNVEVLEANALFWAKAFTHKSAEQLQEQRDRILQSSKTFRRELLKQIGAERKARFKRYDSIANFLEPNLKFGAGALRDLHQALILLHWFPDKFSSPEHVQLVLDYYKKFFLLVRQKLHIHSGQDILTGPEQPEMAKWFGYEKNMVFMREIQKGLARVNFHSEWVYERCRASQKKIDGWEQRQVKSWAEAFRLLHDDPSLNSQALVRSELYESKGFRKEKIDKVQLGKLLKKALSVRVADENIIAFFRSHIISHAMPDYKKVIGLVQHDQYHRFSVDAHLMQAVREVKRMHEHPKQLGKLSYYAEKLKEGDWNILRWSALYHDIAKGRDGAHEKKGKQVVLKNLKAFGFSPSFIEEVAWIVENHLILSTAAFRKNPKSPKTWQKLYDRGVRGRRLYLLTIFTAIDIRATNPDAWTPWKEDLLFELVETLRNPSSERYYDIVRSLEKNKSRVPRHFIDNLDLAVVEAIPMKVLLQDFDDILKGKNLEPLVMRDKKNNIWVRFHENKDQKGLMLGYAQGLGSLGCNVLQASVNTDPKMGVYDWFCVKTPRSIGILKKQLKHNISRPIKSSCKFSKIQLMDFDDQEWVISFRARDKRGLLVSAIQSLYDHDLEIIWAKVHTWGRQIDDIFGVRPAAHKNPQQILTNLKSKLETDELQML